MLRVHRGRPVFSVCPVRHRRSRSGPQRRTARPVDEAEGDKQQRNPKDRHQERRDAAEEQSPHDDGAPPDPVGQRPPHRLENGLDRSEGRHHDADQRRARAEALFEVEGQKRDHRGEPELRQTHHRRHADQRTAGPRGCCDRHAEAAL
jgi:hypothetical protein